MEEKNLLKKTNKEEDIKILIASIINNQIGKKLKYLEEKNDSDIKEINQIEKISKVLIKNLDSFTYKINKKIIEQKYQRKMINNKINIRSFSPSNNLFKKGKIKNSVTNSNHNINKDNNNKEINNDNNNTNLKKNFYKRSKTPLKNFNTINKKNNTKYKRDLIISSKSVDMTTRKNRNNKYNNKLDNQNKNQYFNNRKKYKTPVRKKNKNYFNILNKTADNFLIKKETIDFDLASLDNDIEITKISINYDENKDKISTELFNTNKTRLTIRLGDLEEKIEKEKLLIDNDFIFDTGQDYFIKVIDIIFENLFSFLDIKSFFNIITLNKEYFHLIIKLIINKLENKVKDINQNLKEFKSNNKSSMLKEEKIKIFEYNNSSLRALSILNSITKENFFSEKKINFEDKKIKIIFDLYFIALGKKKDIITLNYKNELREKYIMNYFKNSNNKNFGNIIDYDLKQLKFTDEIINSLFEYSYGKLNFISPKIFQRINKNMTWFCYLIKNILEHLGILNKDNKNVKQIYNLFCTRLNINNELLKKLKKVQDLY